jgi:hypothetical protein
MNPIIKEYQCCGCTYGYPDCDATFGPHGCNKHRAGTFASGIGRLFLGMPKGFDRAGALSDETRSFRFDLCAYETFEDFIKHMGMNKFNVPVWKHLDENGNTLVRGLSPRVNKPYLCVIGGNHVDKIDCYEITAEDQEGMD